jgi:hypothetical protein
VFLYNLLDLKRTIWNGPELEAWTALLGCAKSTASATLGRSSSCPI